MRAGTPIVTPRSKRRSWFAALVVALALALVVGVAPAALAAPNASSAKRATQSVETPSAASKVPSSAIPLLLAGIVVLALLSPTPRSRYGYGSGSGQY